MTSRGSALFAVLVVGLTTGGGFAAGAAPVADAAHAWAGLPFRAGLVCESGTTTSPLASWRLSGSMPAGYLTSPVDADGGVRSAVPPLDSEGVLTTMAVGSLGGLAPAQVAPLAALLSRYGASTDDATVAALARIVLGQVAGEPGLGTDPSLPTCADPSAEAGLTATAAGLVGPYTLAFSPHPAQVRAGALDAVAVSVASAAGQPVPGAAVTFTATSAVFGGADSVQVVTDASGQARAPFTVPVGAAASQLAVDAAVGVPTSLTVVSTDARPTSANPTGSSVPAVVAGPPTVTRTTQTLPLDLSAHPKISLAAGPDGSVVGSGITPILTVTGLGSHRAAATITTTGPLPLRRGTLCSTYTASDFSPASLRSTTSTVAVVGDGQVRGTPWMSNAAGCYRMTAFLTTTDAVPAATARAAVDHAVAVLDTAASARLDTTVTTRSGPGGITLTTQNTYGVDLSAAVSLTGPVVPDGSQTGCTSVDYRGARTSTTVSNLSAAPATATDATPTTSAPVVGHLALTAPGIGCTRVGVALVLHGSGRDVSVSVPLTGSADLLSMAPTVRVTLERQWGETGGVVAVHAATGGTFNQPGHVTLRMARTASSIFGCRGADYSGAVPGSDGPGVPVGRDYDEVAVSSARLHATGCYQPIAVLQMDENHAVTALSSASPDTAIDVGVGPVSDGGPPADGGDHGSGDTARLLVAVITFLVILATVVAAVARFARANQVA